jgi:hypothetical protein
MEPAKPLLRRCAIFAVYRKNRDSFKTNPKFLNSYCGRYKTRQDP